MPLPTGTCLGAYQTLSAIGAGGMGEVYRVRDQKLNRDVALKVVSEAFTADPDRLARFNFDSSADGKHLLMVKGSDAAPAPSFINVILNWSEELNARVPTK